MEPEQVLDLISSAPERYDTVRAALRYRGDGPVRKEIRESIVRSEAGRRGQHLRRQRSEAVAHRRAAG